MKIIVVLFTLFLTVGSSDTMEGKTETFNQYLILGKELIESVHSTRGDFKFGEDCQNLDELSDNHELYIKNLKDNNLIYAGTEDNTDFKTFSLKIDNTEYFCGIPKYKDQSEYTIKTLGRCLIILFR